MQTPSRRALLALSASTLIAGCFESSLGDDERDDPATTTTRSATEQTTSRPTTSTTTTNTTTTTTPTAVVDCEPKDLPTPQPTVDGEFDPKPYPEKPAELTEQTVVSFVTEYEIARAWNRILEAHEDTEYLGVGTVLETRHKRTNGGHLVVFQISTGYETGHSDVDGFYVVGYFVTESVVKRRSGLDHREGVTVDELTDVLQCG
ncbi:hypothetical protein [Haloarchaeobius sp. DFWS5]|uniref:hypothetical protein n=1 Tax=Haloarchaeobius sp. DFWS5 TaxID=3446114 RepID=UPI003EBD5D3A